MTTYLIKQQDGKTFHFRVTIKERGIDIIEGQFYKSIKKYFIGEKPEEKDNKAKILIAEKIADGYKITKFKVSKENDYDVYDKAKYHSGGNFPEELDQFQSFVHTGMYIGWLIDNNLLDKEFFAESKHIIEQFKDRKITGSEFYEMEMDGVLLVDELSEIGNRFSLEYFDFGSGKYLKDYEKILGKGLPSLFHVQDTWENYAKIKAAIDKRFSSWKSQSNKKLWWKVW